MVLFATSVVGGTTWSQVQRQYFSTSQGGIVGDPPQKRAETVSGFQGSSLEFDLSSEVNLIWMHITAFRQHGSFPGGGHGLF